MALRALRDSMLQERDLKSKNEAAKAILSAAQALRTERFKREELSSLTAEGTLPARFLALAMAGLARLGGVNVDPATLEPQVEQIMLDQFNESIPQAPAQKTTKPIHDADDVYTKTPKPIHDASNMPAYLAAATAPDAIIAKEIARERQAARMSKRSGQ
jgi:hypothetical protein